MSDKTMEIYRERVLSHYREPHNQRHPDSVDHQAIGFNPLCGDKLTVYFALENDVLADVAFEGTGCAIAIASASMMTEALQGLPLARAQQLIDAARAMLAHGEMPDEERLAEVRALEGVREYPSRIKCATLAWSAAAAALDGNMQQVSTE